MDNKQLLTNHLKKKGYKVTSVDTYIHHYEKYKEWAEENRLDYEYASKKDMLDYISHLRKKGLSQRTIQGYLAGLSHYFDALVLQEIIQYNPLHYIAINTNSHQSIFPILNKEQLEKLYSSFDVNGKRKTTPSAKASAIRNKVAIGLMVFQGLDVTVLSKLTKSDINVLNGTITIRGSKEYNARVLPLQAVQIIEMDRYINQTRKELQQHFNKEDSDELLVTGYTHYRDANKKVIQRLRKQEALLESVSHIRASVINLWLKQYNLREVQYMAGHKNIHSTEAYKRNDTEGLQMDIDRLHPMG